MNDYVKLFLVILFVGWLITGLTWVAYVLTPVLFGKCKPAKDRDAEPPDR